MVGSLAEHRLSASTDEVRTQTKKTHGGLYLAELAGTDCQPRLTKSAHSKKKTTHGGLYLPKHRLSASTDEVRTQQTHAQTNEVYAQYEYMVGSRLVWPTIILTVSLH